MSGISVDTKGRGDIEYLLRQMDGLDQNKLIKTGLRRAAQIYVRKGRSNLRARLKDRRRGNLLAAMTVKVKRSKAGALAGFRMGGGGRVLAAGNHAHLVDRGTRKRPHPLTGTSGAMPGNAFWTDAMESEEAEAGNALRDAIMRAVERINLRTE